MFEQMNQHKYLDVLEVGETEDWDFRILIAEVGVIENSAPITAAEEPNKVLRTMLNESKPLEVTDSSRIYEVRFSDYITYSVRNESYTSIGPDEVFSGRLARVYTKSAFLEYVASGTFATADYPGPFKHYGFCCLNHIIDVAATEPPTVTQKYA